MRRPLLLQFCASTFLLLIAAGCGDVLGTKDNDQGLVSVTIVDSLARFDAVGRTHRFRAEARDAAGRLVNPTTVIWSVRPGGVATVTSDGEVRAAANGRARVTASAGDAADTVTIDVRQEAAELTISLEPDTIRALGATAWARATVLDALKSPIPPDVAPVSWVSSSPDIATVDDMGIVEAVANGTASVRVSAGGLEASAPVTVDQGVEPEDIYSTVAFVGATVLPMTGQGALPDYTVVVEDGLITAVGPADLTAVPPGAHVIDGSGRFLMPGLTDMHVHIATETDQEAGPEELLLYVANGITTVLNQGDFDGPLPEWARAIRSRELLGPTLYLSKYARGAKDGTPTSIQVNGPEAARAYVDRAHARGYDFMKVYNWTGAAEFFAIADEAAKLGMPVIGHLPQTVTTAQALGAGQIMISHAGFGGLYTSDLLRADPGVSDQQIEAAINLVLENGTWVNATLAVEQVIASVWGGNQSGTAAVFNQEGIRYAHASALELWYRKIERQRLYQPTGSRSGGRDRDLAFIKALARRLHEAGVPLLVGTDSPTVLLMAGFSIYRELALFEVLGLTPLEVLRLDTAESGRFLAATFPNDDPVGTVTPGARADLLLLRADPRESLDNLRGRVGVMLRGRWVTESRLQLLLDTLARRNSG